MEVTMPSSDEAVLFLTDPTIRSQLDNSSSDEMTPTDFIRYLDLDKKIETIMESEISESDKKKAIEAIQQVIIDSIAEQKETTESKEESIIPPVKKVVPKVIAPIRTSTQ